MFVVEMWEDGDGEKGNKTKERKETMCNQLTLLPFDAILYVFFTLNTS